MMLPVQLKRGLADHGHEVLLGVHLSQTVVRARAKDKPILRHLFRVAADPAFRIVRLRIWIGLGILKSWM